MQSSVLLTIARDFTSCADTEEGRGALHCQQKVTICFLRDTDTDPKVPLLLEGGPYASYEVHVR